jgi:hypothetical protein
VESVQGRSETEPVLDGGGAIKEAEAKGGLLRLSAMNQDGSPAGRAASVFLAPLSFVLKLQEPGANDFSTSDFVHLCEIPVEGTLQIPRSEVPSDMALVAELLGATASLVAGRNVGANAIEFVFPSLGTIEVVCASMSEDDPGTVQLGSVFTKFERGFVGSRARFDLVPYGSYFVHVSTAARAGYAHFVLDRQSVKVEVDLNPTFDGEIMIVDATSGSILKDGQLFLTTGEGARVKESPAGTFIVSGLLASASRLWVGADAPGYARQDFSVPLNLMKNGAPAELRLDRSRKYKFRCLADGRPRHGVIGKLFFGNEYAVIRERNVRATSHAEARSNSEGFLEFELPANVSIAGAVFLDPANGDSWVTNRKAIQSWEVGQPIHVELVAPVPVLVRVRVAGSKAVERSLRLEQYAWWDEDPGKYAKRSAFLALDERGEFHLRPYSPRFGVAIWTIEGEKVFDRRFEAAPDEVLIELLPRDSIRMRLVDERGDPLEGAVELIGEDSGVAVNSQPIGQLNGWVEFQGIDSVCFAFLVALDGQRVRIGRFAPGGNERQLKLYRGSMRFTNYR